jgi:hypothetical protein
MNVKQTATLEKLVSAIAARVPAVNPDFKQTEENGNVFIQAPGWPTIQIGRQGGVSLPEIKSYKEGFAAAVIGDQLLTKQDTKVTAKVAVAAHAAVDPTKVHITVGKHSLNTKEGFETGRDINQEMMDANSVTAADAGDEVNVDELEHELEDNEAEEEDEESREEVKAQG